MIKIYYRELSDRIIANYIYEYFKINKINVVYTSEIIDEPTLYLIIGGQYLLKRPKYYGVFQTIPTSHLTCKNKIESYWIDKEYLNLLENARFILDYSYENIKVWEEFYKFKNIIYFDWNFQSCLLSQFNNNISYDYKLNETSPIYIIGEKRGKTIWQSIKKKQKYKYIKDNNWLNIINEVLISKGGVIIVSDYECTYPNLPLISFLRYNNIQCIIDKGRDNIINKQCEELGCCILPFIRIKRDIINIHTNFLDNKKLARKIVNSVPQLFLDLLQNNYNDIIKCKKPKLTIYDRKTIESVAFDILEDGGISLKLSGIDDEDLPYISILTPTGNRRSLFTLAIRNFLEFNYPKDKIEWIILDDGENSIKDIIPNDKRVKYYYDKPENLRYTIGKKRNKLVKLASYDILVFMDDDDYYPPESLIARVKSLLKYKKDNVGCVGCIDVASYDLFSENCAICSNGENYFCESSLAFTRDFWRKRAFDENDTVGEFRKFLEYRQDLLRNLPFQFVTVAFNHGNNTTGSVRALKKSVKKKQEILELFDEDLMYFLKMLKRGI